MIYFMDSELFDSFESAQLTVDFNNPIILQRKRRHKNENCGKCEKKRKRERERERKKR